MSEPRTIRECWVETINPNQVSSGVIELATHIGHTAGLYLQDAWLHRDPQVEGIDTPYVDGSKILRNFLRAAVKHPDPTQPLTTEQATTMLSAIDRVRLEARQDRRDEEYRVAADRESHRRLTIRYQRHR